MPSTNRDALRQLVSVALAPLFLVFGVVSLYLVWALIQAGLGLPALLVLGMAGLALLAAVKLEATAAREAPDAAAPEADAALVPDATAVPMRPAPDAVQVSPAPDAVRVVPAQTVAAPAPRPVVTTRPRVRLTWFRVALVLLAVAIPLVFRLVALDDLPGEVFGDIATIWESVDPVLKGKWPTTFEQSNGPLYGYVIAPMVAVFGQQGFLSYKLASVIVGLAAIVLTFFAVREMVGTDLALLASIVLSATSWHVIFGSATRVCGADAGRGQLAAAGARHQAAGVPPDPAGVALSTLSYYGYAPLLVCCPAPACWLPRFTSNASSSRLLVAFRRGAHHSFSVHDSAAERRVRRQLRLYRQQAGRRPELAREDRRERLAVAPDVSLPGRRHVPRQLAGHAAA